MQLVNHYFFHYHPMNVQKAHLTITHAVLATDVAHEKRIHYHPFTHHDPNPR